MSVSTNIDSSSRPLRRRAPGFIMTEAQSGRLSPCRAVATTELPGRRAASVDGAHVGVRPAASSAAPPLESAWAPAAQQPREARVHVVMFVGISAATPAAAGRPRASWRCRCARWPSRRPERSSGVEHARADHHTREIDIDAHSRVPLVALHRHVVAREVPTMVDS